MDEEKYSRNKEGWLFIAGIRGVAPTRLEHDLNRKATEYRAIKKALCNLERSKVGRKNIVPAKVRDKGSFPIKLDQLDTGNLLPVSEQPAQVFYALRRATDPNVSIHSHLPPRSYPVRWGMQAHIKKDIPVIRGRPGLIAGIGAHAPAPSHNPEVEAALAHDAKAPLDDEAFALRVGPLEDCGTSIAALHDVHGHLTYME